MITTGGISFRFKLERGKLSLPISTFITAIVAVLLLLLSIDMLGLSLGSLTGDFSHLFDITTNPYIGLFIGLLMTAVFQSSSTTTSVAVAAVAAGTMNLEQAIPVILGANIGTTITSTIVAFSYLTRKNLFEKAITSALIHDMFNILGVLMIFPLELNYHLLEGLSRRIVEMIPLVTDNSVSGFWLNQAIDTTSEFLLSLTGPIILTAISIAALFGSIKLLSMVLYKRMVGEKEDSFSNTVFKSSPRSFGWGLLITSIVQSSSLTTSLIVPLAATGKVKLQRAFYFIMGANIGTTITAFLAALFRSEAAMSLALAHFLFNTLVVLIFVSIPMVGKLPLYLAEKLGYLMHRFRAAALVYLTLAFFVIPFGLIYITKSDTFTQSPKDIPPKVEETAK